MQSRKLYHLIFKLLNIGAIAAFFTFYIAYAYAQTSNQTSNTEDTLNQNAIYLGATSCSESTCHGSNVAFNGSVIRRNEFSIWNKSDPHAQAYATLLTPASIKISRNLGINAAHESNKCLNCHANNAAIEKQGGNFNVQEGVGCESCHGAGSRYINVHTEGDYRSSVRAGLYPTADPHKRATLCVSCHLGNDDNRKITHEIMGAGHPRLSFELNTFSSIQPAHYQQDNDYRARKGEITDLQVWAVGQLVATQQFLHNIESFPSAGLFPELVHMDCYSCHEQMSKVNWSANPLAPLPPGELRYNDAYLSMSYQLANAISPNTAKNMLPNLRQFLSEAPLRTKQGMQALKKINADIQQLLKHISQTPLTVEQGGKLIQSLINIGKTSSHRNYTSAEQTAMAINSVLVAITKNKNAKEANLIKSQPNMLSGVNQLFLSLENAEDYRPNIFLEGLTKIQSELNDPN